jgi:hypothetical protein
MSDEIPPTEVQQTSPPSRQAVKPIAPDELMSDFRGHSLVKVVIFTIAVHIFVLLIFSPGYIKTQVFGESETEDTSVAELSEDERRVQAQRDSQAALREVASRYGMTLTELREQLDAEESDVSSVTQRVEPEAETPGDSQIERDLSSEVEGPVVPDLSIDDEDDLFAP